MSAAAYAEAAQVALQVLQRGVSLFRSVGRVKSSREARREALQSKATIDPLINERLVALGFAPAVVDDVRRAATLGCMPERMRRRGPGWSALLVMGVPYPGQGSSEAAHATMAKRAQYLEVSARLCLSACVSPAAVAALVVRGQTAGPGLVEWSDDGSVDTAEAASFFSGLEAIAQGVADVAGVFE